MSELALRVTGLSKAYPLRQAAARSRYRTLREDLLGLRRRWLDQARGRPPDRETFWALKDISFDVREGDVLGIIGPNGAGKSTLLKLLARITEPTGGRAEVYGRVGSLLEVGTGFHPELTGRENIFLNGAILGMTRSEIARKFDEIVAFADVEKFLSTPAKHYSSGMYMRLAFAVAAHLEPEILFIDEVLAVGDAEFQKKCLGKIGQVANAGRTVLFVSHNMDAILRLCKTSLYLEAGSAAAMGPSAAMVEAYLTKASRSAADRAVEFSAGPGASLSFRRAAIELQGTPALPDSLRLDCCLEYEVLQETLHGVIAIRIDTLAGTPVMTITDVDLDDTRFKKQAGRYQARCAIPIATLAPGTYSLTLSAADMKGTRFDYREGALTFQVAQLPAIKPTFRREGYLLMPVEWAINILR
jgi:lipopolysaccharide transport system ATP-binding protein